MRLGFVKSYAAGTLTLVPKCFLKSSPESLPLQPRRLPSCALRRAPQPPPWTSASAPRGQFRVGSGRAEGERRASERNGQVLLNSGPPRGPHPSSQGLRLERKWEGFNRFLTPAPSCPHPTLRLGASARLTAAPRPGRGAGGAAGLAVRGLGRQAASAGPPGPAAVRPLEGQARGQPRSPRRPDARARHFRAVQRRPLGRWLRPVARSCPPTRR